MKIKDCIRDVMVLLKI